MAFREFGNPPFLASEGEKVSPVDETLLADTGALRAGTWELRITCGAAAQQGSFRVERRNAANDATVGAVIVLYSPGGQSGQYLLAYRLEAGERVRVLLDDALGGASHACAAIQFEQLT